MVSWSGSTGICLSRPFPGLLEARRQSFDISTSNGVSPRIISASSLPGTAALDWSASSSRTPLDPGFCDRLINRCRCSTFLDALGFPCRCVLTLVPLHWSVRHASHQKSPVANTQYLALSTDSRHRICARTLFRFLKIFLTATRMLPLFREVLEFGLRLHTCQYSGDIRISYVSVPLATARVFFQGAL